ncbi:Fe-S cluster assembly ATPase SufC [Candidatus Marinimicrobia bacterium MT.SAG.3]|nr:Fe-S cluster assembly ATPase SufC [Candidatus Marinimicrobia bacterium MT.SAG.3]
MTEKNGLLTVENLKVKIGDKEILKGVDLKIGPGEVHAIMGPNGTGKSTLAYALAGKSSYEVTSGSVTMEGENVLEMSPDERARKGLFLAFQYPSEVPGVTVDNFLRVAYNTIKKEELSIWEFRNLLKEKMEFLKIDESFSGRYLNEGFSGGEKKRNEILQMAVLQPKLAVLDETDSGLDIDALQIVAKGVNELLPEDSSVLVITHYQRILRYIKPDFVHVMIEGRIVETGGGELAEKLEEKGYDWLKEKYGESGKDSD